MIKYQFRVLVACECSCRVRDEFARRGWEAWSADLLPAEQPSYLTVNSKAEAVTDPDATEHGNHYLGDCRDLFNWNHPVNESRSDLERYSDMYKPRPPLWDAAILHPPCNDISYAGARWFKAKVADGRQQAGIDFFMEMFKVPSPHIAVENPHSIVQKEEHAGPSSQVVEPWWFGDPKKKQIHLWLRGLPLLVADNKVEPTGRVTTGGGSNRTDKKLTGRTSVSDEDSEGRARRAIVRSRTPLGLARAMAEQWAPYIEMKHC